MIKAYLKNDDAAGVRTLLTSTYTCTNGCWVAPPNTQDGRAT
jgi:hypothetical protein